MIGVVYMKFFLFGGILFSCSNPAGSQQLHINPQGHQVRDVHSKVILSCSIDDFDSARFVDGDFELKWIGPDTQHISREHGRVHIERTASKTIKLYINRIEATDAGLYSCQLKAHGQIQTETVHLSLFEGIRFDNRSIDYQAKVKAKSVLLECSAFGIPLPTISWRFNKTKLPEVSEKYRYEEEGLRIYDVTLNDNGTYECRAQVESQGSLQMRHIHLDVQYPPVITGHPRIFEPVIKGLDAVLGCEAKGNPPVRYEWHLEKRVSEHVKAKVLIQRDGGQTLRINGFSGENEGRYFCRAINSLGMKESFVDVTMLVPPIIKDLGAHVTVEGRTLILPCELVDGRPSPDIFWSKADSEQLLTAGNKLVDDGTISVEKTHRGIRKLIIRNIQRSHSGNYLCQAINAVGNASKIAKIAVDYSPEINSSFSEVFGWADQVRHLTCTADGQPPPVISWFSRGQHIFDSPSYKIETVRRQFITSTLQITVGKSKQSWLFGNYTCTAKNSHGSQSAGFHLREAVVPVSPHNVSVLKVSATKALLLAAPPEKTTTGSPLTSWKVKYEKVHCDRDEERIFLPIPGEELMTMTVTELEPSSEYTFHLSVGNEVGFGEPIKFLVKTNQQSDLLEQSDVPHKSAPGENTWKDPAALGKVIGEDDPQMVRSYTGGAISALVILILLSVVGGVFWYRRRRNDSEQWKWCGLLGKSSSEKDHHHQQRHDDDGVIQMGEVKQPTEFFPPLGSDRTHVPTEMDPTLKTTNSFESGFLVSPRPPRAFNPATQPQSLNVTPMSVRRLGGRDQTWSQTHESIDDLSSGFGTAEPESIQSDLIPDDETGTRSVLAQHDPDLDSIPDIDDDEEQLEQL